MAAFSSVTLHVSLKNPISVKKLKIISPKLEIVPQNFFPERFYHKTIEYISFKKYFVKNQLRLIFPKKNVGFKRERAPTSKHCFK